MRAARTETWDWAAILRVLLPVRLEQTNTLIFVLRYKAWPPSEAILSSILGAWFPGVNSKPQWLQVDLRKTMNVTGW